jgi:hypothetical protein
VKQLVEPNKQPGLSYAFTDQGLELPVIDVTHPAFRLTLGEAELSAMTEHFLAEQQRFAKLPGFLRSPLLRLALRGSILGAGLRRSQGTFLDGLSTYLLKLGAANLGRAYAKPVDSRIVSSLPALSVRLRLQDMATLLSDALRPRLSAEPARPLHLLNIAGGPAIDSLNALIVLWREQPSLLSERRVLIRVLDPDESGPAFGARALAALQAAGTLAGVTIDFRRAHYDWREPAELEPTLAEARAAGAITIGSSEGGLFEYGSDAEIVANLRALARGAEPGFVMVGSVTRDDETVRASHASGSAATRPRGLAVFSELAASASFSVRRSVARPISDQVVLEPRAEA